MVITGSPESNGSARESTAEAERLGWTNNHDMLADFIGARLVNRRDVFGGYFLKDGEYHQFTGLALTAEKILAHCRGETIIGGHSTSPDNRCRWFVIDIDAHDGDETADPERNRKYALHLARKLRGMKLSCFVLESNGKGGYHLWCILKHPAPSEAVFQFVQRLVADHGEHGFAKPPEHFPKQAQTTADQPCGNWVRFPGRHHKRAYWGRVMVFDGRAPLEWQSGEAAVVAIVGSKLNPAKIITDAYEAPKAPEAPADPIWDTYVTAGSGKGRRNYDKPPAEWVADALTYMPPGMADAYDPWLFTGMALHSWDPQAGYGLWLDFSRRCSGKFDQAVCLEKWSTFTGGGIGISYVFRHALDAGWPPLWNDAKVKIGKNGSHPSHSSHSSPSDNDLRQKGAAPFAAPFEKPPALFEWKDASDEELGLVDLTKVQERPIRWEWQDYIASESLNLIAGQGDVGKSSLIRRIVANGSRGLPMGPGAEERPPFRTIYASAEESLSSIVKPRLIATGADISMVTPIATGTTRNGRKIPFTVQDVSRLAEMLRRLPDTRLIVIDPISSYLGQGVDDNRNNEVRRVLVPLRELAEEFNVSVLMNHHFGKPNPGRKNMIDRILGSVGYKDVCRTAHVVITDPEDPAKGLLVTPKNNLVAKAKRKTLSFRVVGVPFEFKDQGVIQDQGVAEWLGVDERTLADLERAQEEQSAGGDSGLKLNAVTARLIELLGDGESHLAAEIYSEMGHSGFSVDQVKKHKSSLPISGEKDAFNGPWKWTLHRVEEMVSLAEEYRRRLAPSEECGPGSPKSAAKSAVGNGKKTLKFPEGGEECEGCDDSVWNNIVKGVI